MFLNTQAQTDPLVTRGDVFICIDAERKTHAKTYVNPYTVIIFGVHFVTWM